MAIRRYPVTSIPTEYPEDAQVEIDFAPREVSVTMDSSTGGQEVYVSWDGVNDHVHLMLSTVTGLRVSQRGRKIWLRGVGTPSAQVIAED